MYYYSCIKCVRPLVSTRLRNYRINNISATSAYIYTEVRTQAHVANKSSVTPVSRDQPGKVIDTHVVEILNLASLVSEILGWNASAECLITWISVISVGTYTDKLAMWVDYMNICMVLWTKFKNRGFEIIICFKWLYYVTINLFELCTCLADETHLRSNTVWPLFP